MENENIKFLKEKLNLEINAVEFAELRATAENYNSLGIKLSPGKISAWGLLLFTSENLYYYIPVSEHYFEAFMNKSRNIEQTDQLLNLSEYTSLNFETIKKSFFSFLDPENSRTLVCSIKKDNQTIDFDLILNKKAETVLETLKSYSK